MSKLGLGGKCHGSSHAILLGAQPRASWSMAADEVERQTGFVLPHRTEH